MASYPHLFSPLVLAGQTMRNRVALCATVTNYARANRITERWKNFLIERARGGAAMLVTVAEAKPVARLLTSQVDSLRHVFSVDELRARELLAQAQQSDPATDWRCDHCGEPNTAAFELCWQCQSDRHSGRGGGGYDGDAGDDGEG